MVSEKPVILVVDDDQPILLLMRNVLREFGFESRTAASGAAAIAAARETTPDLVLLDKNMPGTAPEDVIRQLRAETGLQQIPIIILSGEPVDADEIARLGATAAVLKPFDISRLIERIRSHVGVTS